MASHMYYFQFPILEHRVMICQSFNSWPSHQKGGGSLSKDTAKASFHKDEFNYRVRWQRKTELVKGRRRTSFLPLLGETGGQNIKPHFMRL